MNVRYTSMIFYDLQQEKGGEMEENRHKNSLMWGSLLAV